MATVRLQEIDLTTREGARLSTLAKQIRDKLESYTADCSGWIQTFCGFRTPNGERTDNDIVIFGSINNLVIARGGNKVRIQTFAAVIECKGHAASDIFIEGNDIKVRYPDRRTRKTIYASACQQADECARSVRDEIYNQIRLSPYVEAFVWLYNYNGSRPQEYSFSSEFSADDFFRDLAQSAITKKAAKRCIINTSSGVVFQATGQNMSGNFNDERLREYAVSRSLSELSLKEGALTRARVERITKKAFNQVNQSKYFAEIGEKMLAFIGGPGTGKTASLIYSAKWLAEDGQRILLLTYNHVLKCDLKRLIYYAGLSSLEGFGINPKSSTLFFTDLLCAAGLTNKADLSPKFFDQYYEEKLKVLLAHIKSNCELALSEKLFLYTSYDLVMIDEAQDWPAVERDLIFALWGAERIILASSPDQLTRGGISFNDWTRFTSKKPNKPPRKKCLRQARMLVDFNRLLMQRLNYEPLQYEPDQELGGGKIILCEGEYTPDIHRQIIEKYNLKEQDDYDVCLACHQGLGSRSDGFYKSAAFAKAGFRLWDACSDEVRKSYPIGDDMQRMMFYESSRGIEAWAFVSIEIDVWLEDVIIPRAEQEWEDEYRQLSLIEQSDIDGKEISVRKQVSRWALIALSRAVAINIINVSSLTSKYGAVIYEALKRMPEELWEKISAE